MVHNGIEYIDMQLIGEAYFLIRNLFDIRPNELAEIFVRWNEGDLDSYLIQITADILKQRDPRHPNEFLVDYVLDTAQQKGTGKWTSINALDLGIPANSIAEAVFARCLSALKAERVEASRCLRGPEYAHGGNRDEWVDAVRDALYCSKICAYAQGFQLMRAAEGEYGWKLDLGTIASIWRGGCIIRARFLQKIADAYLRNPKLGNLLLDPILSRADSQKPKALA
jgi:6-phosphogluconate dehydrogenase